jgi:hypothetical protein
MQVVTEVGFKIRDGLFFSITNKTTRSYMSVVRIPVAARFSMPSRPAPRSTQPTVERYRVSGSLQGVKRPQCGADHPPPYSSGLRMGWSCISASTVCLHKLDFG